MLTPREMLSLRNKTVELTVDILNTFGAYLHAESNSPEEDQLEAALNEKTTSLMNGGDDAMGGHVILALLAMMHNCADPDRVQQWLDDAGENLLSELEALNAQDH